MQVVFSLALILICGLSGITTSAAADQQPGRLASLLKSGANVARESCRKHCSASPQGVANLAGCSKLVDDKWSCVHCNLRKCWNVVCQSFNLRSEETGGRPLVNSETDLKYILSAGLNLLRDSAAGVEEFITWDDFVEADDTDLLDDQEVQQAAARDIAAAKRFTIDEILIGGNEDIPEPLDQPLQLPVVIDELSIYDAADPLAEEMDYLLDEGPAAQKAASAAQGSVKDLVDRLVAFSVEDPKRGASEAVKETGLLFLEQVQDLDQVAQQKSRGVLDGLDEFVSEDIAEGVSGVSSIFSSVKHPPTNDVDCEMVCPPNQGMWVGACSNDGATLQCTYCTGKSCLVNTYTWPGKVERADASATEVGPDSRAKEHAIAS